MRAKECHSLSRTFGRRIILAVISVLGVTGCTRPASIESKTGYALVQDISPIFSTRPDPATHAFVLVKLKSAPLLRSLDSQNGHRVVNAASLKNIDAEQKDLLKKLQALSPDIAVLYRYRMTINAFAIVTPTALLEKIGALSGVSVVEPAGQFDRPTLPSDVFTGNAAVAGAFLAANSVKFIGATDAHSRGLRGQGMKVGIIDSGIDYTHAMFGGVATEAAYKAIDPSAPSTAFPNTKVVGGLDFVGTTYDAAAIDFKKTVPVLDVNPLDEGGHGTHVAGTVAGRGDGINTYDGVAPDAALYALKVFGAKGSTSDSVVIAALEYAADPNGDGDISDRLDVVNLSLGSGYGNGQILYSEAIGNISTAGTVVVCSGGNSGDTPYIVGAPGVSDDALSVAASLDDMEHGWKFRAAKFTTVDKPEIFVEAVEGTVGKPLADSGSIISTLVPAGLANVDFPPALAAQINGKIALIDRGIVSFGIKVERAQKAGAIAVVVVNNQPGNPTAMSGDKTYDIPAIMVTQDFGNELKEALKKGDVTAQLTTTQVIERPELIDTMAGFSSKGPRSIDALLKPEIAAPGSQIISAKMGGGAVGTKMSGTSMAAPHMAGVLTLMKQSHPDLSAAELKSLVMATAKTMVDEKKVVYPISRQGAGRVQVMKALDAPIVTSPTSVSLGEVTIEARKNLARTLIVKNISAGAMTMNIELRESTKGLSLTSAKTVTLAPGKSETLDLRFTIDVTALNTALQPNSSNEISGLVVLSNAGNEIARVPVIAIANKTSRVQATDLWVRSTSNLDAAGSAVDLRLTNKSLNAGDAFPFNLIARDARKSDPMLDPFHSKFCDLAETGYRVITKNGIPTLQIAAKLYEPTTTWDLCQISVLIDSNGDHVADQELAGMKESDLPGLTASKFSSILLDAATAQQIRRDYEAAVLAPPVVPAPGEKPPAAPVLNYVKAIEALSPMMGFNHSTIAIVETAISDLKLSPSGALAVRIATSSQTGSAIEPDDFLSVDPKKWKKLNVSATGPSYVNLPESVSLKAGETKTISFSKGAGSEDLWLLYPTGKPVVGGFDRDLQSQTIRPIYKVD